MTVRERRSPKGLVGSTIESGGTLEEWSSWVRSRSDESIRPGYLDLIRQSLDTLESSARRAGGTEKGNLGAAYDGIHLASEMLNNVLSTKSALAQLVEERHCELAKQIAYYAIAELIGFAVNCYHWNIVANETAIESHSRSVDGARRGAKEKGKNYTDRNVKMAERFLELKKEQEGKRVRASDSALMDSIGEEFGLRPTAARAAIKKGLKILATRKKVVSLPGNPQTK